MKSQNISNKVIGYDKNTILLKKTIYINEK
jgi:hypothetical protein